MCELTIKRKNLIRVARVLLMKHYFSQMSTEGDFIFEGAAVVIAVSLGVILVLFWS